MAYFDFAYLTVQVFMINVVENKLSKIHSELQTVAMKLRDNNLTTEYTFLLLETRTNDN